MAISFQKLRSTLLAAFFLAALLITFLYFLHYPIEFEIFIPALAFSWLGSPVVTLITCIVFLFCERPFAFIFSKTWAGFYAALVFISCATFGSDGSLGAGIAQLFLMIMICILCLMLAVIAIKNFLHHATSAGLLSRWLFRDTFAAIVGGWSAGIIIWSLTTPSAIVAAAEKISAGAPYCINSYFGPARSLEDLTALKFYKPAYSSLRHIYGFHGTLSVIENQDGDIIQKHLYYWSYRKKTFLPYDYFIYDTTINDSCIAEKHFAKKLPVF